MPMTSSPLPVPVAPQALRPLAQARGLVKVFPTQGGPVTALDGLDLTLQAGDFLAVMGASGSGKSTLLAILGCLDRPTRGSYHLDGREVAGLGDRELSRLRAQAIGFIFQTFNLLPQLSVLENVALPFLYRDLPPAQAQVQARQAIERVGLQKRLHHRPAQLSGGEMQRAAIARALAVKPLLVLADEPTGNLDSANSRSILDLFKELNQQGVTLVVVTHDPEVAAVCDRVIRLRDGRLEPTEPGR